MNILTWHVHGSWTSAFIRGGHDFWDNSRARTRVIEHGVPDPGHLCTGEPARAGVVVNEPVRRTRVAGTDLLPRFAGRVPLDVFGMKVAGLPYGAYEDLPQHVMHAAPARRRAYLHPYRCTSPGPALVETMHAFVTDPERAAQAGKAARAAAPARYGLPRFLKDRDRLPAEV
ncbi:hypothetical protein ACFFV7_08305 [Nonomuraea spiralis]|uniref:Uncharacterized protein n=1 Tax=Nonomuraea spiralis TaxID=46182 RepID=A0ABV5I9G3_9ACTN|nr:hypothetical protein [Nonomuraea spiralis]GGT06945.1 hypothetical protein GCM10010176_059270 [Nonomuraea spiralis]